MAETKPSATAAKSSSTAQPNKSSNLIETSLQLLVLLAVTLFGAYY